MGQGRVAGSVGVHSWGWGAGAATGQGGHKGAPNTEGMTVAVAGGGGGGVRSVRGKGNAPRPWPGGVLSSSDWTWWGPMRPTCW